MPFQPANLVRQALRECLGTLRQKPQRPSGSTPSNPFTSNPIQGRSKVGHGTQDANTTALPTSLTPKQLEILHHLVRFRFLTRSHFQHLLHHQHHKTIQDWLTDLTNNQYLSAHIPQTITDRHRPTVYHLASNAIRYLKDIGSYDSKVLSRLSREADRSEAFIQRCLILADISLSLRDRTDVACLLPSEYPGSPLSTELSKLAPHAFVIRRYGETIEPSFIEVVNDLPATILKKQLGRYIAMFDTNKWQLKTDQDFPTVLLIGLNEKAATVIPSVVRFVLKRLDKKKPRIRLTTRTKLKEGGLLDDIWQELTESPRNAK